MILDTSGLLSALDPDQNHHESARLAIEKCESPFLSLSPFVLAELDYLISKKVGQNAALALLEEVARGAYRLEDFTPEDIREAGEIMKKYLALDLGLADASLIVLAKRHDTLDILTLDERHFRAVPRPDGKPFRLLPADL